MATQTTGLLSAEMKTYYDRLLLRHTEPTMLYCRWGQKRSIPTKQGKGPINWRRFNHLDEKTTPLTEGVTPPSDDISIDTVEATPLQYGAWVQVSDVLTWTAIDPVLTETIKNQGIQAGETMDTLCRDVVTAGTTVRYAGTSNTARNQVQAADVINGVELRKLRRTMRKNNARMVNGAYPMVVSPDTMYDLQSMTEWQAIGTEQRASGLEDGMVRKLWGFAFYESERAAVATAAGQDSNDVHLSVAFGADAYGIVDIAGHNLETITKELGSGGSTDPLNQRQTAGWKAMFVSKILNESYLARLEHGVTA